MAKSNPLIAAAGKAKAIRVHLSDILSKEQFAQFLELVDWLNAQPVSKRPSDSQVCEIMRDKFGVQVCKQTVQAWRAKRANQPSD